MANSRASEQKIVVNAERRLFYCWSWDKWKGLRNIGRCFAKGCRRMYEPEGEHLRLPEIRRAAMGQ